MSYKDNTNVIYKLDESGGLEVAGIGKIVPNPMKIEVPNGVISGSGFYRSAVGFLTQGGRKPYCGMAISKDLAGAYYDIQSSQAKVMLEEGGELYFLATSLRPNTPHQIVENDALETLSRLVVDAKDEVGLVREVNRSLGIKVPLKSF